MGDERQMVEIVDERAALMARTLAGDYLIDEDWLFQYFRDCLRAHEQDVLKEAERA